MVYLAIKRELEQPMRKSLVQHSEVNIRADENLGDAEEKSRKWKEMIAHSLSFMYLKK